MSTWDSASHLLCVRLDSLGDVLMTSPAMRALKDARPGRRLVLLTSPAGTEAATLLPEVDETIVFEPAWMKHTPPRDDARHELALIAELRARAFDGAAIFTVFSQNPLPAALTCYLAGIPLRLAHCHENPYQLLTDWVPDPEPAGGIRHEVQRQLDLVAATGAFTSDDRIRLAIPRAAKERVGELLAAHGIRQGDAWVAVHPGASAASRRYPVASFRAAVAALAERGLRVVVTGNADEASLVADVAGAAGERVVALAGVLDVPGLAALIEAAPVLITNNTGPAHIAAGVGTATVVLYALTNPQHTPWRVPSRVLSHDVPCRNCFKSVCPEGHHACLALVPPAQVVEAALELVE